MKDFLCWMTDYFAPECWQRACVDSDDPTLPCRMRQDYIDKETAGVS